MKIKKSDLKLIIERYLSEQMSFPVDDTGSTPSSKYPDYIVTDNQKQQYDVMMAAKKRAAETPESEAGLQNLPFNMQWPQDFVIFEKEFNQHIENWKIFKRDYPKSAFILQLFDMSGVSSYGDLAESIKKVSVGSPSVFDSVIFWFNIVGALPIGLVLGLFSGRLGVKAANTVINATQKETKSGLTILGEFVKASSNWGELLRPDRVREFFLKPKVVEALEKTGIQVTEDLVEIFVKATTKFCKFVDSFGFRAFMRTYVIISQNLSEKLEEVLFEWLASETSLETVKTSDIVKYLVDEAPSELKDYLVKIASFTSDNATTGPA
jgi:hypothetical protein